MPSLLLWSAKKAINIFFCEQKLKHDDKKSKKEKSHRHETFLWHTTNTQERERKLDKCIEINPLCTGN